VIPTVVNGKEIFTGDLGHQVMPTDHGHRVSTFHCANAVHVQEAIDGALQAQRHWEGAGQRVVVEGSRGGRR